MISIQQMRMLIMAFLWDDDVQELPTYVFGGGCDVYSGAFHSSFSLFAVPC